MLFSSITFLYYFLPITLLVYFIVPEREKNIVLLAASFLFYFWGEPRYCLLMIFAVLVGYIGGIRIEKTARTGSQQKIKWRVIGYVGTILGILLLFKYADFLLESINAVAGSSIPLLKLALPLGISFYTFQIISYLVDVRRGEIPAERNLINFASYVMMFPQLVAGPIVRYSSIMEEMKNRKLSWERTGAGCFRFSCGLAKKVLIADMLSELVQSLDKVKVSGAAGTGGELGVVGGWVLAAAFTLQIYYDFSGYSDMAIGLGQILGFTFPENFHYPFTAKSITEFWRRWHMTLGGWFRDYVYIPLGGSRVPFWRGLLNIFIVWILSGLWHGANWNFALWGLYFAFFLFLEKTVRKVQNLNRKKEPAVKVGFGKKAGHLLGHIYTILVVVVSFVIFRQENLNAVWDELGVMFGAGKIAVGSATALYEIKSYGVLLVIAMIGATPCVSCAASYFAGKLSEKWRECLIAAMTVILLLASTAFMIGSSAHPFLYFRF